jgi:hypothetical protein
VYILKLNLSPANKDTTLRREELNITSANLTIMSAFRKKKYPKIASERWERFTSWF